MPHRPAWFKDDEVFVSYADTCGINKDGNILFKIDPKTGKRTDEVDDRLIEDIEALLSGKKATTGRWVSLSDITIGAPRFYDVRYEDAIEKLLQREEFESFEARSLGNLIDEGLLAIRSGHGSPSGDKRKGDIPYIKVSDLRAGQVNINPSNMVSEVIAKQYWRSDHSGLKAFDLITPIRASKNIGEFALLMPGQEQVVLTKEMLVIRTTDLTDLDNFYLLWALSLKVVRQQWNRVVLMQTNREDVGERYREILLPWPIETADGEVVSAPFRDYYQGVERLRRSFTSDLAQNNLHHVFLGTHSVAE